MKPPPSSHLAKRILFLETPWRTWWARAAPWLLKRLKPVWTIPVPWLRNVSGVMVPCLAPPSMPVACWFHLPPICPFYPQCQFHFLLVFIKFAMTFHLGGLTIKTSFLEMGQQVAVLLGRTCPEGTMCNTEPSSPTLPVSAISSGPGSAPWALEEMHRHQGSEHLPPHHRGRLSALAEQLGQKTGCEGDSQGTGCVCQTPN